MHTHRCALALSVPPPRHPNPSPNMRGGVDVCGAVRFLSPFRSAKWSTFVLHEKHRPAEFATSNIVFLSEEAAKMRQKNYECLEFGIIHNCQTHFDLASDLAQTSEHRQDSTGLGWHLLTWPVHAAPSTTQREPSHVAVSIMAASGSVGVMAPQQEQQRQQDPESLTPMTRRRERAKMGW